MHGDRGGLSEGRIEWGETLGERDCETSEASLAAVPGAKTADTRATREEEGDGRAHV